MTRLLLAVAALVAAVGCGGVENEPNLAAAIEKTEAAGSSLFEVAGTEKEDGRTIEIVCRGKADYERARLQMSCDYGRDGALEAILVDESTYMRGEILGFAGAGTKWTKFADAEALGSQVSPQQLLTTLRAASQETRRVGEDDVRGVETVHYRLDIDCEKAEFLGCEGISPAEVWIDEDGLVRRILVDGATIEFYDFGVAVDIEPPPADEVEDLEDSIGPRTCRPDDGTPISLAQAVETMQRNGFTISDGASCHGGSAVFRNQESGQDRDREGQLSCLLYFELRGGEPTSTQRRGGDRVDAELTLRNLTCAIFVDSPRGEARIDRLEAAFAELERQIRP